MLLLLVPYFVKRWAWRTPRRDLDRWKFDISSNRIVIICNYFHRTIKAANDLDLISLLSLWCVWGEFFPLFNADWLL